MIYALFFVIFTHLFAVDFPVEIRDGVTTHHYKLDNGLDVYITENPKAPLVSVYHWVKAGSLHEKEGSTGIAHLFEHMMFRPVKDGEAGFFDKITALGGSANANTRYMATLYTTTVPQQHLEALLKIEADRFQNLVVTDKLLDIERKAVWSEYSTKFDTNPVIDIWGKIYQVAFPGHPYEWTIIGYREDLEKINAKDSNDFYKKYYSPNNTGLFISGDVRASKVIDLVKKYYSTWSRGEVANLPAPFKKTTSYKEATGRISSSSKQVLLGFRLKEEEKHSLEYIFLNHVLFGSAHSLAEKRIKDRLKLASGVSEFNFDYDSGMLKAFFVLFPKTTPSQLVKNVLALKDDFKQISKESFEAYKQELITNVLEASLRNENLNEALALSWGKYGDIGLFLNWQERVKKLSRENLHKVLDGFYTKDNMVVVKAKYKE